MNNIKLIGKAKIINNEYVLKKKEKDLGRLFNILDKKEVNNHPVIIEDKDDITSYKYIVADSEEIDVVEYASIVARLHNNTSQNKKISKKKYKDAHENIISYIDKVKEEYNTLILKAEEEVYPSPSNYLLSRNYSLFYLSLEQSEKDINKWYNSVKENETERICILNNNLKLENTIKSDKIYLLSWEKYIVDSPVLDIYKLIENDYKNIDILSFTKTYLNEIELSSSEKLLLKSLIEIPIRIKLNKSEIDNIRVIKEALKYQNEINKIIKSGVLN